MTVTAIHKETGHKVTLNLQPASTDQISPGKPVGVPSWVPSEMLDDCLIGLDMEPVKVKEHMELGMCSNVAKCFYFVVISPYVPSSGVTSQRTSINDSMASGAYSVDVSGNSLNSGMSSKSSWKPISSSGNSYGDYTIPEDLTGLELGPLIGSGGFGKGECCVLSIPINIGSRELFFRFVAENQQWMLLSRVSLLLWTATCFSTLLRPV